MIRLTWRQMRLTIVCTVILLAALVVILAITRDRMTSFIQTSGLAECLEGGGDCTEQVRAFTDVHGTALTMVNSTLWFVPLLIGLFWGAPLIAREIEQGTHRMVWTQSITRRRWFVVKIAMLALGGVLIAIVITRLFSWWAAPFMQLGVDDYSRIAPSLYDMQGTVQLGIILYAFTVAVCASAFVRRTVPAMAVALAGFVVPRLIIQWLRDRLVPVHVLRTAFGADYPRSGLGDWIVNERILDRIGSTVSPEVLQSVCSTAFKGPAERCASEQGYYVQYIYHPLSSFWPLQGIETGIFLAAAVLMLAGAWWMTQRIT
jgi:hypothetical protein